MGEGIFHDTPRWSLRSVNHLNDRWEVLFRTRPVAVVQWIKPLEYPQIAKDRIAAGLNGEHGDGQPARCWTLLEVEGRAQAWEFRHNGDLMGEIGWSAAPPNTAPSVWIGRVLAGLNFTDRARRTFPSAPASSSSKRWAS
jgi:hypothetical protein